MIEQRPHSFVVEYNGLPLVFTKLDDGRGYSYQSPLSPTGRHHWIDTESGTRHKLAFDEQARATITGSLKNGDWHVVITDGVAKDT